MKADLGRGGAHAPARVPLRVLIVEDSEDEALLLLRELERGGYEPEHERVDTPEAMEKALATSSWDVVLSDWWMPRFSATGALEMLRKVDPEAPFIIVSGAMGEEAAVEAMRAGAHDYIMKDNLTRLCATVERGLEEAQTRRERELAEKSLKESEERFRSLVMNSSDMMTVVAPDGSRLYTSPSIERVLGYKLEEMIGGNAFDLVHPDDAPTVKEEFAELARTPGTGKPFEFRLRHADGSWRVFESIGANLLDDPSVGGLVFNARDVTDRKRAEEALKESEERYRRLVELSPDTIVVHSGGTILFVNTAVAELLGAASPEEFIGKPIMDFVHPDYRGTVRARIARSEQKGERNALIQEKLLRLDGGAVDVEVTSTPIIYRGEVATLSVIRDITGRKRAEEELRRREAILEATAFAAERFLEKATSWEESVQEVLGRLGRASGVSRVYIFENYTGDDGATWTTQRYEWVAPGVSAQIDNSLLEAFPYRAAGWGRWEDTLGRGEALHGHVREFPEAEWGVLRAQDIESIMVVPISVEGEWWGFIGFDECEREREWSAAEIEALKAAAGTLGAAIERDRAERTLRESEERYRAVVEHATEGIFLCDAATGDVLESNAAFKDLLGYAAEDLQSIKIHDLIADDRESIDSNIRLILDEGSRFLGERRYRRKDGSLVDIEASASLIFYGGRKVICDVIRDVTERVEAFRLLEERVTALARISASLTIDRPMETTLNALAAGIVEGTAAVACAVVLIDAETGMLRLAGSHGLPEGYTAALEALWRAEAWSPSGEVFRSRQPFLFHDARRVILENPLYAPIHHFVREAPWDTIKYLPLVYRGRALGTINLYYLPGQEPGEDESVFLGAVADQTAVAVENARLFATAQDTAALEERQRLARELHDSVSQALYGIVLGTDAARTLLDRDPGRVAEPLEYVLSLAKAGLAEMRALIFELRPESLATEGLIAALEKQAALVQARHELAVHAALCDEPDAPLEVKETVYRVAQEALNNTVKHAQAKEVELRLEKDASGILLEVRDDGKGFDPANSFPGHLGLKSMRERVARLGGTFRIESTPEEGTRIRVRISAST
ncbi:MAG TPA: PAS domain S-box protein [Rubrobacter sp.]|nr:PAS domain S-box protein [Rubrobacter sp.]